MIAINRVMVFPQAYAAIVPNSDLVVKTKRMFIVDIGGYTTDVLLLRYGKPDQQFCRSLENGIITMNNKIIRKAKGLYDNHLEYSFYLPGMDLFESFDEYRLKDPDYCSDAKSQTVEQDHVVSCSNYARSVRVKTWTKRKRKTSPVVA